MPELYLREDLEKAWHGLDPFETALSLKGELFRDVARRRTLRVEIDQQFYFLKLHQGVGWPEIFKNMLSLRMPILGAENEYRACQQLQQQRLAAPHVAAYGRRGWNPASQLSFVLCEAVEHSTSLETLTERWHIDAPDPQLVRALIRALAVFARRFHSMGLVHRDFYICHFLVDTEKLESGEIQLTIIDLHRAVQFPQLPEKWRKRDLAALLYSVMDLPLSRRNWLRFMRLYTGRPLRETLEQEGDFWRSVYRRALALYRKGQRKGLVQGRFQP